MNFSFRNLVPVCAAAALALSFSQNAKAGCASFDPSMFKHAGFQGAFTSPRLLHASLGGSDWDGDDADPIVGFWHVKFYSDGISSGIPGGIPKGVEVDAGYSQWHSDGTEIMNSGGRAPNTGDFCLGVWARVGPRTYKLNHFAAAWDPTAGKPDTAGNPVGQLIGPGHITETVTLSADGQSFSGTFAIDQLNESNALVVHIQGAIKGTRINVNTPPSSVF